MLLKTAQVTRYKCVKDSTEIDIDESVTCLVGKNEAGKTTILEALNKLNPVRGEDRNFDVTKEYFRPEVLEYQPRHQSDPDVAVTTTWELEAADHAALERLIGPPARSFGPVTVRKRFNNAVEIDFAFDEAKIVRTLLQASSIEAAERGEFKSAQTVQELVAQLGSPPPEQKQRNTLLQTVQTRFGGKQPRQAICDLLLSRVPHFAFFTQYLRLPGQLSVNQFKQRAAANQLTDEDKVFTSLLEMIGMTVDSFVAVNTYEDLIARLEAASGRLTRELRAFWPDGQHLSMDFRFDDALPGDPPPFNTGKIFRARIKNDRYDVTTGFDQRSNGFIWFFSFLVWFTQLEKNYKTDLVVLLDEPGLSLHGTAQKELLRFIEHRLAPKFQVIYTTHSLFMLDPSNLQRARPVQDVYKEPSDTDDLTFDPAQGTKVFKHWWDADRPTLFPLMACVAFDLAQPLFIGLHNVLVEGVADYMYIEWFRSKLAALKRPTLDKRWRVTPCGSISKIGAFLNLFGGNHLHCAVVCDYAEGHKREVRSLNETAVLAAAEVITVEQFATKPEADIEDLLGDEFYAALVNACYGLPEGRRFAPPQPAGARIVKAVEDHMRIMPPEIPEFTHPGPADYLLRKGIDANYPGIDTALDRFQALFERLNANLSAFVGAGS